MSQCKMKNQTAMKACIPFFVLAIPAFCQGQLLPHIGSTIEPLPQAEMCTPGDYFLTPINNDIGYQEGSFVNDFTVFDANGGAFNLSAELANGKPILLVSASYTCPVFRGKVALLNSMYQNLSNQLNIAVIYTVEAHPTNVSPYFGYVNIGQANQNAGILFEQPTTYGERLAIAAVMMNNANISFPIYFDGVCNDWLEHFGPAPNMAYLLDTEGRVISKHPWFHSYPDHIICDLEDVIVLPQPPNCIVNAGGEFTVEVDADIAAVGEPGTTLYTYARLVNGSDENVLVEIERIVSDLPALWNTSICTSICLPPGVNYTQVLIAPGQEILYTHYFFTSDVPGIGSVFMRFRNASDTLQTFTQWFYGNTMSLDLDEPKSTDNFRVYPNPASDRLYITGTRDHTLMRIYSADGRIVLEKEMNDSYLDITALSPGVYLLHPEPSGLSQRVRFVKE